MDNKTVNAVAKMITKTTSVMTPLLIMILIVAIACTTIFVTTQAWLSFIPLGLITIYGIYRYERFSNEKPHMLSTTEVQQLGMTLGAYGSDQQSLSPNKANALEASTNPANKKEIKELPKGTK